jgi:hypothetical protein
MNKTYCDICGKETNFTGQYVLPINTGVKTKQGDLATIFVEFRINADPLKFIDMCKDCVIDIVNSVKNSEDYKYMEIEDTR